MDFYGFAGQAGRWITLHVYGYDLDMELTLQAADGSTLATGSTGTDIEFQLPANGTYYLRARSTTYPTGAGDYTISYDTHHSTGDIEPNDTPAQAVPAAYGDSLSGYFSDTDTVDYYRFAGQAGDQIVLASSDVSSYWYGTFSLYDPAMNPVPLNTEDETWDYTLWAELPVTGNYVVKVTTSDASYGHGFIDYLSLIHISEPTRPY